MVIYLRILDVRHTAVIESDWTHIFSSIDAKKKVLQDNHQHSIGNI